MMHKQCAIVKDLLPSYVEGLLSEESRAFVEAHLAECTACSGVAATMGAQIAGPETEPIEDAQVIKAMRKSYRSIRVRNLAIAVVVGVAVFAGVAGLWNFLQNHSVPLSGSEADLFSIGEAPNGDIYWQFGSTEFIYGGYGYSPRINEAEKSIYLELNRSLLGRSKRTPEEAEAAAKEIDVVANPDFAWALDAWVGNGRLYSESGWLPLAGPGEEWMEGQRLNTDRNAAVEIQKIYIGSEDDFRLAWQAGDEIPQMPYDPKEYRGRPSGAPNYDTDLRVATASEGRAIMEYGLKELGIALPPYELTYPDWNGQGLARYEMRAQDSPYSMYQHADERDIIMGGATFFRVGEDAEKEMGVAEENLRDLWILTMRSVYPELSDADAAKLVRKMENNMEPDEDVGDTQLRGGARLGDYGFSLVQEKEGSLDGYLQIVYLGVDWPKGE